MLLEQGKLKLDDPVSKYLDGFDKLQVITKFNEKDATYETRPAKTVMTIRHLLTHTSGIGYSFTNPIEYALVNKTKKGEWELPLLDDPGDEVELLRQHARARPHRRENDRRRRSSPGIRSTSSSRSAWWIRRTPCRRQAVAPAAAVHAASTARSEPLPKAHVPSTPTAPFRGDGGLYSTVEDYCKFVRMLLNGGTLGAAKILSPASVKMMGENKIGSIFVELQPDADKQRTQAVPARRRQGQVRPRLSDRVERSGDAKFRSPGSMSWAGIFNTEFWVDPVKHIGGVQMMQLLPFYDDGAIRTLRDFEETVYRELK